MIKTRRKFKNIERKRVIFPEMGFRNMNPDDFLLARCIFCILDLPRTKMTAETESIHPPNVTVRNNLSKGRQQSQKVGKRACLVISLINEYLNMCLIVHRIQQHVQTPPADTHHLFT